MEEQEKYNFLLDSLQQKCKELYFVNGLNLKGYQNPLEINDIYQLILQYDPYDILTFFNNTEDTYEMLKLKISKNINDKDVLMILDKIYDESENSYIVGGSIRDILLDEVPKDFDFVTDIHYDRLKELFSDDCFSFKETGNAFLVFNLSYNGVNYEIANFRHENNYKDGRRPSEVRVGTIEEDRQRRDFHLNSIYWNKYELYIHRNAVEDIQERRLRFIGDPDKRLEEDYLRIMRFYRLLKTKNLKPDNKSLRVVRKNFEKMMGVSPHRIMMEIERICL